MLLYYHYAPESPMYYRHFRITNSSIVRTSGDIEQADITTQTLDVPVEE